MGQTPRVLAGLALAVVLAVPPLASAQEAAPASPDAPLDARPITWRGVRMGGEQVFEGDYAIDYETSAFRPDGAADPAWLAGWEDRPGDNGGLTRRYHLRFVGRQTLEPGKYGALGAYGREVLITRLISRRLLIGR